MSRYGGTYIPTRSTCPRCKEAVLVYDWDDMQGCYLGPRRVDPTPLTPADEAACTVIGRPVYALETTIAGTYRLSRIHRQWHRERAVNPVFVPEHRCGARYNTQLPKPRTLADYAETAGF